MDTKELIKKVRRIEIKTKVLSGQIFAGEYLSAFKGKGMAFSEVREYQYGDDIRNIDWNVTARFNHPYVKVFEEERELTVIILLDLSGSSNFGTQLQLKRELIAEVSAVIAFSAMYNNDKIGAIFFTDNVEKFIPPKKGRKHVLRIISEILNFSPKSNKTNISNALQYFANAIKKRSIAFVLSDFFDTGFENSLKICAQKHDIIALKINDYYEKNFAKLGLAYLYDPENQKTILVDFSNKKLKDSYEKWFNTLQENIDSLLKKYEVDFVNLYTGQDYVKPLMQLFKTR
ncbi:MAG: DUF58 domain-containing protein [Bacteroidales bacterium]|nr:DUF58 domain-containing protein [Bacteroidales bacterium]